MKLALMDRVAVWLVGGAFSGDLLGAEARVTGAGQRGGMGRDHRRREGWSGSLPAVVVDESSEDWVSDYLPVCRSFDRALRWPQIQGAMWPALVVVADELPQRPPPMALVEHDDTVQALLSHRSHPSFSIGVQVWGAYWQADSLTSGVAEQGISVGGELAVPVVELKDALHGRPPETGQPELAHLAGDLAATPTTIPPRRRSTSCSACGAVLGRPGRRLGGKVQWRRTICRCQPMRVAGLTIIRQSSNCVCFIRAHVNSRANFSVRLRRARLPSWRCKISTCWRRARICRSRS
jgi:hypothetical protein